MAAMGGAPTVRRRSHGLLESTRTPGTVCAARGAKRAASGSAKKPAAPLLGKQSAGGGGAGVAKPRRCDRERQLMLRMEPAQRDALVAAFAAHADPARRLLACRTQRTGNVYDETLPLSPPARPCATPECRCAVSVSTLANTLGLGSPSGGRAIGCRPILPLEAVAAAASGTSGGAERSLRYRSSERHLPNWECCVFGSFSPPSGLAGQPDYTING